MRKSFGHNALGRYRYPLLLSVVALGSLVAVDFQWTADYPLGDGGLFHEIIRAILADGLRYPRVVDFNGAHIPLMYSPAAFYGCALLAIGAHTTVAHAMNWWVGAWVFTLAPCAFWCARRFGLTPAASIITAAALVTMPQGIIWLGFGGGVTRAPGFAFFILTAGEYWNALRTQRLRDYIAAGACAGACAMFHMEFAFLVAVTCVVLCLYRRPAIRSAAAFGITSVILSLPWTLALLRDPHAAGRALQTGSMNYGIDNAMTLISFFGLNPAAIAFAGDAGLIGIVVLAVAAARRRTLFLVWVLALFAADSRAVYEAAHLPVALAFGSFAEVLLALPWKRVSIAGLSFVVLGLLSASGSRSAMAARLSDQAVDDIRAISAALPSAAAVVVLPALPSDAPDFLGDDQTFEWYPAFSRQESVLTYVGLEWVDKAALRRRWGELDKLSARCVRKGGGSPCVLTIVRSARKHNEPVYVYSPRRGTGRMMSEALREDRRFRHVIRRETADVFLVQESSLAAR